MGDASTHDVDSNKENTDLAEGQVPDVLVVEDDDLVSLIVVQVANQVGMSALAVSSYEDAVPYLAGGGPDVIVLDLTLPGIDGITAMRLFGQMKIRSKVIILSSADESVLESATTTARSYGIDIRAAIHKPVPINSLRQELLNAKLPEPGLTREEVDRALIQDGFVAVYQPKVDIQVPGRVTGKIKLPTIRVDDTIYYVAALETLARLPDADGNLSSPLAYLGPRNDRYDTGLFARQVVDRALLDLGPLLRRHSDLRIAFNVVPGDLEHILNTRNEAISSRNENPVSSMLDFEIAADYALLEREDYLIQLETIARNGHSIVFDNVADGFSSYISLRSIKFSEVKLDRALVHGIENSPRAQAVAMAVVEMAHGLGAKVTAVGVETRAAAATVKGLGFDYAQGNHFCEPRAAIALEFE